MAKEWKSWCRLCARENGNEIDVFIKSENLTSLADAIQNYFSIPILDTDAIPTKICNICYDIVTELINFALRTARVQDLFHELLFNQNLEAASFNELRIKHGLAHQMFEFKILKESSKSDSHKELIKINEEDEHNYLDENVDGFFKCDNTNNFEAQNEDEKSNFSDKTSEDEKPLVKRKSKKRILERQMSPRRRRQNIFPEDFVESKLSDKDSEKDSLEEEEEYSTNEIEDMQNSFYDTELSSERSSAVEYKRQKKETKRSCKICRKSFNGATTYNCHMKTKHNLIKKSEPVVCKTCGKTFKKLSKLEEHENMHLPPEKRKWYDCPQCDKKFAVQTSIQLHIRAVHVREKTFICEECGKAFVTSDQLNSHKVVHSDFTPFKCPKCPKSFKRLPSLKNHIDSHEDTKYICNICGCQLNTKTILRRHMVIHSDEKKYKCNFCQKEFKRTKALKNHLILHTGLKPYECPFCEQTFANGSNCRKHQKNSHPTELAAMEQSGEKKACRNVPRLEHLKAVNNAAIINPNDSINPKVEVENVADLNISKFCNNPNESNVTSTSSFETDSQTDMCDNLNFSNHQNINVKTQKENIKAKTVMSPNSYIAADEISSEYQN